MRQEDYSLLEPGMRVRIAPQLRGEELYDANDTEECRELCGQVVTVRKVIYYDDKWMVMTEENPRAEFFMEEIECIVDDEDEIPESDESLEILIGR